MHRFTLAVLLVPIAAAATALPVRVDRERVRLEKQWGIVEDPDGDCTFRADLGRLTIGIPGTPHALSADIGKTNGPRLLREVDGDFHAQVKVAGAFPVDPRCLMPGRWAFFGAGLLVWQDDKNYVRFERARMHLVPSGRWRCYPSFAMHSGGRLVREWQNQDGMLDEAKCAWLRLVRRGTTITASYRQDGDGWKELPPLQIDFGAKVRVGVDAVQNTPAGFEAIFETLRVGPADVP